MMTHNYFPLLVCRDIIMRSSCCDHALWPAPMIWALPQIYGLGLLQAHIWPRGNGQLLGSCVLQISLYCGFFYKAWSNMTLVRFGKEKKRKTKNETKIPKPLCSKTVIAL